MEKPEARNKPRRSLTIDPELYRRAEALARRTKLSVSRIIDKALEDRLGAYEADPGELMRPPKD